MNQLQHRPAAEFKHRSSQFYVQLNHDMPGYFQAIDFINFDWPCFFDNSKYDVIVQTLDNSTNSNWRNLGPLQKRMMIPNVMYDPYATMAVVPREHNEQLPKFISRFSRGSNYTIPQVPEGGGEYRMKRSGADWW